jgi:hypothetical protein
MKVKVFASICLALVSLSAHAVYGIRSAAGALSVTEVITDLGGGQYQYDYTLNNTNAVSSVWWWGVYSPSNSASLVSGSLGGLYAGGAPIDITLAGNPSVGYAFDFAALDSSSYGITVGSSGTLSFITDSLETGGKTFFADITGEWAGISTLPTDVDGTQSFSYMGNTQPVPEPMTMAVLGLGAAALLRRHRK